MSDFDKAIPYQMHQAQTRDGWEAYVRMMTVDWDIGDRPASTHTAAPPDAPWVEMGKLKIKCQYCGQWGAQMSVCECCGGPTQ